MIRNTTRRGALVFGVAGLAGVSFGLSAFAKELTSADSIADFAGDADIVDGKITLKIPEIAENGASVPIAVHVDSVMAGDDFVEEVIVVSTANPNPGVAAFRFTELSGVARASTRMRLAQTQDVIALARMKDGSIRRAVTAVKVTVGGCGG